MELNRRGKTLPLYIQIKNDLLAKISYGEIGCGEMIPSEQALGEEYGVSRITIREAITELVNEKYLVRRQGKGTYVLDVSEQGQTEFYTQVKNFTYEMQEKGLEPLTLNATIQEIHADARMAKIFAICKGAKLYLLERTRGTKEHKIVHFMTYLSGEFNLTTNSEDYYGSLYELLYQQENFRAERISETLEAVLPSEEIQNALDIKKDIPVLKRIRYSYHSDGRVIEYTEGFYISEHYNYKIEFIR